MKGPTSGVPTTASGEQFPPMCREVKAAQIVGSARRMQKRSSRRAEQAFRDLISEMYHEIAMMERKKKDLQSTSST